MDPNVTLTEIRRLIVECNGERPVHDMHEYLMDMIEKFILLDTWLSNGGVLPKPWLLPTDDRKMVQ